MYKFTWQKEREMITCRRGCGCISGTVNQRKVGRREVAVVRRDGLQRQSIVLRRRRRVSAGRRLVHVGGELDSKRRPFGCIGVVVVTATFLNNLKTNVDRLQRII